jgi:ferredoxin-like protein FixX
LRPNSPCLTRSSASRTHLPLYPTLFDSCDRKLPFGLGHEDNDSSQLDRSNAESKRYFPVQGFSSEASYICYIKKELKDGVQLQADVLYLVRSTHAAPMLSCGYPSSRRAVVASFGRGVVDHKSGWSPEVSPAFLAHGTEQRTVLKKTWRYTYVPHIFFKLCTFVAQGSIQVALRSCAVGGTIRSACKNSSSISWNALRSRTSLSFQVWPGKPHCVWPGNVLDVWTNGGCGV